MKCELDGLDEQAGMKTEKKLLFKQGQSFFCNLRKLNKKAPALDATMEFK